MVDPEKNQDLHAPDSNSGEQPLSRPQKVYFDVKTKSHSVDVHPAQNPPAFQNPKHTASQYRPAPHNPHNPTPTNNNSSFVGSKGKRRAHKASARDGSVYNAVASRLPADHFSLCYGIIDYRGYKFLITDRPAKANIYSYVDELLKHDVKQLVRVCESEYPTEPIAESGIVVKNFLFQDGFPPPFEVYSKFLESVKEQVEKFPGTATAIHCVAGLGRAPVMVAIALIELGMNYLDAVEYIRSKRRGAINLKQLDFLESYKPVFILKPTKKRGGCALL